MSLNRVHKINPNANTMSGWHKTFCGLEGMRDTIGNNEYVTTQSNRFEATVGTKGVTCKKCYSGRWSRSDDPTGSGL